MVGNQAYAQDRIERPVHDASSSTVQTSETFPVDPDPWRFNFSAYAWLMSVSGNVTARNQTMDTNATFIDLLQKSDSLVGFMGYFEANKGRVGFYTDVVFSKLGFGAGQTSYRNPIPGLKLSTTAGAALTYQMFIVEPGGAFELFRSAASDGTWTALDGTVGLRYWNNSLAATFDVNTNIDLSLLHIQRSAGIAIARADVIQWFDPVFGLRLRHQFTPRHEIALRGDIGGFGLGSQFTWQALAVYGYNWQLDSGSRLTALLGFRALGVNYSSGSGADTVGINEVLYGPIIGVSYRF